MRIVDWSELHDRLLDNSLPERVEFDGAEYSITPNAIGAMLIDYEGPPCECEQVGCQEHCHYAIPLAPAPTKEKS